MAAEKLQEKNIQRVGLSSGVVGLPSFVFFSDRIDCAYVKKIQSLSDLSHVIKEEYNIGFEVFVHFFRTGGNELLLTVLPTKSFDLPGFLGDEKSFTMKKGIKALSIIDGLCDILVFPQIVYYLDSHDLFEFYQALHCHLDQKLPVISIIETRVHDRKALEKLNSEYLVPMHSFLLFENKLVSPACVLASLIQQTDIKFGMIYTPSSEVLPEGYLPLIDSEYPSSYNSFKKSLFRTKFSGYFTLNSTDLVKRNFAVVRTYLHMRRAIEELCENYIFEILNDHVISSVEMAIVSLLKKNIHLLASENGKPYSVKVDFEEDTISVDVDLVFPYTSESVNISYDVKGVA